MPLPFLQQTWAGSILLIKVGEEERKLRSDAAQENAMKVVEKPEITLLHLVSYLQREYYQPIPVSSLELFVMGYLDMEMESLPSLLLLQQRLVSLQHVEPSPGSNTNTNICL